MILAMNLGPLAVARVSPALWHPRPRQVYATDIGMIGTVKIPIPLDGSYINFKM